MKIKSLKISNVLSFKFFPNIDDATEIHFEDDLNILIGQNGSGKSTVLEVVNFIFKRVLFNYYSFDEDKYSNRASVLAFEVKRVLKAHHNNQYSGFRLEPNWDFENSPQKIKVTIVLDEIDKKNLGVLENKKKELTQIAALYSEEPALNFDLKQELYSIEIILDKTNKEFSVTFLDYDAGVEYLKRYNFYKELITIYNFENPTNPIDPLNESFTLLSGYRNYSMFTPSVSVQSSTASYQIRSIKSIEYSRSINVVEQQEPPVFGLVRLKVASNHYELYGTLAAAREVDRMANDQPFLNKINSKLKLINLRVEIKLLEKRTWSYSFNFYDIKRNKIINDINSLSAGQKSILHLIFEAYGRGDLHGGIVIIDEPELHLHYHYQAEYLEIIKNISAEQNCQYILVTHSESLINSATINHVKRFTLDRNLYTWIASPKVTEDHKTLIKILDNTRSTYAFFSKKIILVEGDTDRYFFKAILLELHPELTQEISVLDIGGKGNYEAWKIFFEGFGMTVFYIGDFDNVYTLELGGSTLVSSEEKKKIEHELKQGKLDRISTEKKEAFKKELESAVNDSTFPESIKREVWKPIIDRFINMVKLSTKEVVDRIRQSNPDIEPLIADAYRSKIFLLNCGSIEEYIGTKHGDLNDVVVFCNSKLNGWLQQETKEAKEIKNIFEQIISQ